MRRRHSAGLNGYYPMQPKPRGGRRTGAGRKPSVAERATRVRSFTLDDATYEKIQAWQADARNHAASLSESLRQMIDLAVRRREQTRKYGRSVQTSAQSGRKPQRNEYVTPPDIRLD